MKPVMFLHIPRTSGIAYRNLLKGAFTREEIREEPAAVRGKTLLQWQDEFVHDSQHKFIAGHWGWNIVERIPDVQVITILRYPVTRCVSDFNHHLREETKNEWNKTVIGIDNFFDFIDTSHGYSRMSNAQVRQLCGATWGQKDVSLPDNALQTAKDNIDKCFWVNFTESPKRMLPNRVNHELWWGERDSGTKVNITPLNAPELDSDIIERIIELNQLDFMLYKHARKKYYVDDYFIMQ